MKLKESIMEILEAFDLMGSYRGAASLLGCSHHTVERYVKERDAGRLPEPRRKRVTLVDLFEEKITEWVNKSSGKIRGDVVHDRLVKMGYLGSQRTTHYAVRRAKVVYRADNTRVHRPWVTEPGLWLQYDFGDGPVIDDLKTVLFCAWLAWSKYRVVVPLRDRSQASVIQALDRTFRALGGVPTYVLSDNEKTLTTEHIAGLPVRNSQMVDFAKHYFVTMHSCVPYDPATKGGVERSVGLAKADIVPTSANLLEEYVCFADLEDECSRFMVETNTREHSVTRRTPQEMLAEEVGRLHPVPEHPFRRVFGVQRVVPSNTPMITFERCQYSVPYQLMGETLWVRTQNSRTGNDVVVVNMTGDGPVEVARHEVGSPGVPRIEQAHFPDGPQTPLEHPIRPRTRLEKDFVAIGPGAKAWLREAAATGVGRIQYKMERAVVLAKTYSPDVIDQALGLAAINHRFTAEDLVSIVNANTTANTTIHRTDGEPTLAQGTGGWASYGAPLADVQEQNCDAPALTPALVEGGV
jgi:transposase